MSDKQTELTAEEEGKVREALEKIEAAQNLINHAAQELSPVSGFADEWSASSAVHDTVKDYWYRVEARLAEIKGIPPSVR